eukprot:tig00020562_g11150.t1
MMAHAHEPSELEHDRSVVNVVPLAPIASSGAAERANVNPLARRALPTLEITPADPVHVAAQSRSPSAAASSFSLEEEPKLAASPPPPAAAPGHGASPRNLPMDDRDPVFSASGRLLQPAAQPDAQPALQHSSPAAHDSDHEKSSEASGSSAASASKGGAGAAPVPEPELSKWRAVSLRWGVLPALCLIMIGCIVAIVVVSFWNADAMSENLNSQLLVHVGYRVQSEVLRVFMEAVQAAEHCAWSAARNLDNTPATLKFEDFPTLERDARATMHYSSERPGPVITSEERPSRLAFDPRRRPYYTAVVEKQEPAWVVYPSTSTNMNAMSFSLPFFQSRKPFDRPAGANMQGIFSITLNVVSLNKFLTDLVVTPNGIAVVTAVGEDGRQLVVAYRDPRGPRPPHDPAYALVPVANFTSLLRCCDRVNIAAAEAVVAVIALTSRNPLVRAFVESLPAGSSNWERDPTTNLPVARGDFTFEGTQYTTRTIPVTVPVRHAAALYARTDSGRPLTILVAVASPHDDFKSLVIVSTKVSVGVGVASFSIVALVLVLVSVEITRQLRLFVREVHIVSSLRVPARQPGQRLKSRLKELHMCADAIEKLRSMISIVAGMTDAVVVLGSCGRVTKLNARAIDLFGIKARGSITGVQSFADLFLPFDADVRRRFDDFLRGEGSVWSQEAGSANTREFTCHRLGAGAASFPAEISVGTLAVDAEAMHVLVIRDVSERQTLISNVRASESKATALASDLRNLLEFALKTRMLIININSHSNAPIVGVGADGNVEEWNGAMERIAGCSRENARGRPFASFVAEHCREAFQQVISGVLEGGEEVENYEVEAGGPGHSEGGGPVRLMVSGAARRDASGAVVGGIFVGQDMSEKCSEQLLSVVNDLLDISKLEAGMVTLESIVFDLRDVVEGVCELVAPACYTKGIEIVCHLPPELPGRVRGDPTRVRQILINLGKHPIERTIEPAPLPRPPRPAPATAASHHAPRAGGLGHNACKFTKRGHVLVACEIMHGLGSISMPGSRTTSMSSRRAGARRSVSSAVAPPPDTILLRFSVTDTPRLNWIGF